MFFHTLHTGEYMPTTGDISQEFENSLKRFTKYLVDLHKLQTFDSVAKAEEEAYERMDVRFEEMDPKEIQIVMLMRQMTEIYARDRQMQITNRNPYEIIIQMDEAAAKNGYFFWCCANGLRYLRSIINLKVD